MRIDRAVEASTPEDALINALIDLGAIDVVVGMPVKAIRQGLSKIVQARIPCIYTTLYEGGERTPGVFADLSDRVLLLERGRITGTLTRGDLADRIGMSMSDDELRQFSDVMEGDIQTHDRVSAAPDDLPVARYPRSPGYRPGPSENPQNAWYCKTEVHGAVDGPMRGKRIVLKDNVALAGVPMMNSSAILGG